MNTKRETVEDDIPAWARERASEEYFAEHGTGALSVRRGGIKGAVFWIERRARELALTGSSGRAKEMR
jgi:hypothetical protein